MTRFVLAYRTEYDGLWTESINADNLHWIITEGKKMAELWTGRQYAVFVEHPPASWQSGAVRARFGLSDAQLYERKYGQPMPLDNAAGTLVSVLDRSALVE